MNQSINQLPLLAMNNNTCMLVVQLAAIRPSMVHGCNHLVYRVPPTISDTHGHSDYTPNFYYYIQYEQGMYFRSIRHGYSTSPPFYLTLAHLPHKERCAAYIPLKIYDIFFIYEWGAFLMGLIGSTEAIYVSCVVVSCRPCRI